MNAQYQVHCNALCRAMHRAIGEPCVSSHARATADKFKIWQTCRAAVGPCSAGPYGPWLDAASPGAARGASPCGVSLFLATISQAGISWNRHMTTASSKALTRACYLPDEVQGCHDCTAMRPSFDFCMEDTGKLNQAIHLPSPCNEA